MTMSQTAAAWVRENAWTDQMRREHDAHPALDRMCACQYGPCTWCADGEHAECKQTPENRRESPATWITRRNGTVPCGAVPAAVYEVGHRHVWACPCLPTHSAQPEHGVQGDLLELLAVAS